MSKDHKKELYRLSTDVQPFMKTAREDSGYKTSYAQIRIHHGTHADFPTHVGLDGEPQWNLSGPARITHPDANLDKIRNLMFFATDGEPLPTTLIDTLLEAVDDLTVVGVDHAQVGNLDTHRRLLSNNIIIIENLVNLRDLSQMDGYAYCFSTIIDGCDDGAPISVAFDPNDKEGRVC